MQDETISFHCVECGKDKTHRHKNGGGGLGFAERYETGDKVCYECCGKLDRARMIETGTSKGLPLYLDWQPNPHATWRSWSVTNWCGSLAFPVSLYSEGKHNIAGTRTDVWFDGPDGRVWHGVQYGGATMIIHCKRTKERITE